MKVTTNNVMSFFLIGKKKYIIKKDEILDINKCDIIDKLLSNKTLIHINDIKKVKIKKQK